MCLFFICPVPVRFQGTYVPEYLYPEVHAEEEQSFQDVLWWRLVALATWWKYV